MLLIYVAAILGGFVLLTWGADRLVNAAASLAQRLHVSTFVIGVVILGFGTSLPELLVSSVAAFEGSPAIAIGNAFGSNIANIALILGVSALICPLLVERSLLVRDLPLILMSSALVFWMLQDLAISRIEGVVLMLALVGVIVWIVRSRHAAPPLSCPHDGRSLTTGLVQAASGLVLVLGSAWVLVWSSVGLARMFGIDELLIGLTLIAIGTSLPELATSLAALRRPGGSGLIIGNVIGSNLFNTLGVVGLPAVIEPLRVSGLIYPSGWLMFALTVGLGGLLLLRPRLALMRPGAAVLILCYTAYLGWNMQHMIAAG